MYYGDADYDDGYGIENDPMPGGDADGMYDDVLDDGLLDGLLIVGLAASLLFLIYWRQQHQAAHNRDRAAAEGQAGAVPAEQPQGDGGLFPQPGDPEFGQWVAGGVGH